MPTFRIYHPRTSWRTRDSYHITIEADNLDELINKLYTNYEYRAYIQCLYISNKGVEYIKFQHVDDVYMLHITDDYYTNNYYILNEKGDEIVKAFDKNSLVDISIVDLGFDLFKLAFLKSLDFHFYYDESSVNYFMNIEMDGIKIQNTNIRTFISLPREDFDLFG
jgi:hypothetical protein